jgi:hypothetical protein
MGEEDSTKLKNGGNPNAQREHLIEEFHVDQEGT